MRALVILIAGLFSAAGFASSYPVLTEKTPFPGSRLYVANVAFKNTSIIMLHGSEGGSELFNDLEANVLATQGYSVLVLCYFDCNRLLTGPRETLKDVEATRVLEAVSWLRARARSNGKVVVYGFSRGAELAMITGSLARTAADRPDAIIGHSPSDVFNGAWNWNWKEPACWLCKAGVGKCSEASPESDFRWNPACGDDPDLIDHSLSAWKINGKAVRDSQHIEIEKYDGPILITSGEKDEVWPVAQTRRIEATLKKAGRKPEIHYFPEGGHSLKGADEIRRRELVLDFLSRVP